MDRQASPELDLERFFEMTSDGLVIASADGYFKKVNPSFCNHLGYTEEHLLATPFLDFVHPDDLQGTIDELNGLQEGANTIDFQNRFRQHSGDYRILSWSARPDPETGLMYCVARDVTELIYTRDRLQRIYDALTHETIFAMTDRDGRIVEANDKFCEISGFSREELLGQTHQIVNSGQHPPEFFDEMWADITQGKIWSGLIENRRKDNTTYFVQTIIIPLYDDQGAISNFLAIRFDTTRHVQVKEELRKTLDVLNLTGEIAKVGGWEMDVATGALTWTDETYRMLGVRRTNGTKPFVMDGVQLFIDEHQPVIRDAIDDCIELGKPWSLELKARTPAGQELWVYTNGYPQYEDGKVVALYGTIQDIDEQKKTREALETERMKSIQSSKLASLGEMAAGVAHEINNPLSVIYGSTQLMPRYLDDPGRMMARIEEVEKSGRRIGRIVNSLRKFSRSDEEHMFERHDLDEIAREAITLADAKARRHMTEIRYATCGHAWIRCDEVEIEQVVVNLINNAIDAVKDLDERQVDVELANPGDRFELSVSDSGSGLSQDIKERVFEPFFTTKVGGEGTGLGLSITKGILDDHGAKISIDEDSERTRFVVTFQPWNDKANTQ